MFKIVAKFSKKTFHLETFRATKNGDMGTFVKMACEIHHFSIEFLLL